MSAEHVPPCQCGVRPAAGCPGAWEQGCDLGSNPDHVAVASPDVSAAVDKALGIDRTIAARPLEWDEDRSGAQWTDKTCGFCIMHAPEDDPEKPYSDTWGESDAEDFATLDEAKAWCQREIDGWVRQIAVAASPQPAQAPTDPMATPLPCDVKVGHVTMRKGVPLRTLVSRMQVLYEMATAQPESITGLGTDQPRDTNPTHGAVNLTVPAQEPVQKPFGYIASADLARLAECPEYHAAFVRQRAGRFDVPLYAAPTQAAAPEEPPR